MTLRPLPKRGQAITPFSPVTLRTRQSDKTSTRPLWGCGGTSHSRYWCVCVCVCVCVPLGTVFWCLAKESVCSLYRETSHANHVTMQPYKCSAIASISHRSVSPSPLTWSRLLSQVRARLPGTHKPPSLPPLAIQVLDTHPYQSLSQSSSCRSAQLVSYKMFSNTVQIFRLSLSYHTFSAIMLGSQLFLNRSLVSNKGLD